MLLTFFEKYIRQNKRPDAREPLVNTRGKGFSIIETLVAITILTMVIAGSITAINKGLSVSTETRNRVTASLLAQDAMEYVKNRKFINIKTLAPSWLSGFGGCRNVPPFLCRVDSIQADGLGISFCPVPDGCPVYINNTIGYYQTPTGTNVKTPFERSFYLEGTDDNERKVVVKVTWKTAGVSYSVKLADYIFKVAW
ncbi:MAG: prepilin-type N-terminal cleavage/methylation domain-containing protein [Patescibacteria group bacterium]